MKNFLRNSLAVFAMALIIAACNPNGMNDRDKTHEETTIEEHSVDTMTVQDTMKGTGSGMGKQDMKMHDTTTVHH